MRGRAEGWALVTGASGGLGAEFARQLAARGYDLVLTARREEPMRSLADELERLHGSKSLVEPLDLAAPGAAAELHYRLQSQGVAPEFLIANAAFGLFGRFIEQEEVRLAQMLQVDVVATTELAHRFGRDMAARGRGGILLVASVAAFQPTPLYAAYGAAKSYILSLGHALHVELGPSVGVTVLAPGLMDTGFLGVSGQAATPAMRRTMTDPVDVVRGGIDALLLGRASIVVGRLNRVGAFLSRFSSRDFQARMILRIQS